MSSGIGTGRGTFGSFFPIGVRSCADQQLQNVFSSFRASAVQRHETFLISDVLENPKAFETTLKMLISTTSHLDSRLLAPRAFSAPSCETTFTSAFHVV